MRFEDSFYKLTTIEQEIILIKKMEELQRNEDSIKKLLGTIRGGGKIQEPRRNDKQH